MYCAPVPGGRTARFARDKNEKDGHLAWGSQTCRTDKICTARNEKTAQAVKSNTLAKRLPVLSVTGDADVHILLAWDKLGLVQYTLGMLQHHADDAVLVANLGSLVTLAQVAQDLKECRVLVFFEQVDNLLNLGIAHGVDDFIIIQNHLGVHDLDFKRRSVRKKNGKLTKQVLRMAQTRAASGRTAHTWQRSNRTCGSRLA